MGGVGKGGGGGVGGGGQQGGVWGGVGKGGVLGGVGKGGVWGGSARGGVWGGGRQGGGFGGGVGKGGFGGGGVGKGGGVKRTPPNAQWSPPAPVPYTAPYAPLPVPPTFTQDYAERHGVPKWYSRAEDLIGDPEVDAIYIATPPSSHKQYCLMVCAPFSCPPWSSTREMGENQKSVVLLWTWLKFLVDDTFGCEAQPHKV